MTARVILKLQGVLQDKDHRPTSCRTFRAEIAGPNGPVEVALKDIPRERIIAEVISAITARVLRIRAPHSYLVVATGEIGDSLTNGIPVGDNANGRLFFASEILRFGQFSDDPRRLLPSSMEILTRFPTFHQVIAFDLLIANVDRQDKNLFVDENELIPFDHDQALFGLNWTLATLRAQILMPNHSTFDLNLTWCDEESRIDILALTQKWARLAGARDSLLKLIPSQIGLSTDELNGLTDFLVTRAGALPDLMGDRFKNIPFRG